jgi:chromosome segregation ATPase
MALKQLLLTRKIDDLKKQLEEARAKDAGFLERKKALETRESELEAALNEVTDETPEADKQAVEAEVTQHEADEKALADERAANEAEKQKLTDEIAGLQKELDELNARAKTPPAEPEKEKRKDEIHMETRKKFFGMTHEERTAFFARSEVKDYQWLADHPGCDAGRSPRQHGAVQQTGPVCQREARGRHCPPADHGCRA